MLYALGLSTVPRYGLSKTPQPNTKLCVDMQLYVRLGYHDGYRSLSPIEFLQNVFFLKTKRCIVN